jgi:enoyl-CoA hydratase
MTNPTAVQASTDAADAPVDALGELETVLFDVDGHVATVTLNRPEKLNAMNEQMNKDIITVFTHIKVRTDISVVILKGAGRSFCAGHDLNEWVPEPPYALGGEFFLEQRKVFERFKKYRTLLWELPQPVICQIQGHCLTTGIELSMNCDLVVVADDAKIAIRTVGGGGLYFHLWPWLIGVRKTKELVFTGRWVSGVEAERLGMANASVPADELDAKVQEMAEQIARVPLAFLWLDKQCANKCFDEQGLYNGVEYSATMHAMSHLTDESHLLSEGLKSSEWKAAVAQRDARYQNG